MIIILKGSDVLVNDSTSKFVEIDPWELFVKVMWKSKWFILLITFVFLVLASIYIFFIAEPVYETSSELFTPDFQLINGTGMKNEEYLSFIKRPEIKQVLIKKHNLDLSLDDMGKMLSINTNSDRNNTVLRLKYTDKELAVDILNNWINLFNTEVQNYMNGINNQYINKVEELLVNRENEYIGAEKSLTDFEKGSNINLLNKQLDTKANKLVEMQSQVMDLNSDVSILENKYILLQKQLENTKEFIITNSSLDDESIKLLNKLLDDSNLQTLTTKQENINQIYYNLQSQKNQVEVDLSAKKEELNFLDSTINKFEDEIMTLQEKLASLEEKQKLLSQRVEETFNSYQTIQENYSTLRQDLERQDYKISTINRAIMPDNPISPNKKLIIVIAAFVGILLSIFIVFIRQFFVEEKTIETLTQ